MDWESSRHPLSFLHPPYYVVLLERYEPFNMVSIFLFFCRMPDPDFSVNDVKMFVGKTSQMNLDVLFFFF